MRTLVPTALLLVAACAAPSVDLVPSAADFAVVQIQLKG